MENDQELIEDLVQRCLALPEHDDDAIEGICREHPELASEVRAVLRSLSRVGLIAEPVEITRTPERVGDYRLLRRLGGGGMGEVYLAEQQRLGRQVALKLMRPGHAVSRTARARFRREIDAVAGVDHAGICPVLDAGEIDGVPFLAMRYLDGETLAQRILRARETGGVPVEEGVALVEKVAAALHAAHEKGLVHRDVKPGNVMVTESGEPVLLDFGLARLDEEDDEAGLTRSGDRLGTPAYMAPEQVAGQAVDRRTDVYGLGATLYELLTGRPPFEGPTREALYRRILAGESSRASTHNPRVPRDLEIVLETALDPDPARRYQTARDFADDLRRVRAREPVRAKPLPVGLRARRWVQRHPVASVAMASLALGLSVAVAQFLRTSALEQQSRAMAWLQVAGQVEDQAPEFAFKCGREALRLEPDNPRVMTRVQELMFGMREHDVLLDNAGSLQQVRFSPDGRMLLVSSNKLPFRLYRRGAEADSPWHLMDTLPSRSAEQTPPTAFSPDSLELALGAEDGSVYRYDVSGDKPKELLRLEHKPAYARVTSVRYSPLPDATKLITAHLGDETDIAQARLWSREGHWLADLRRPTYAPRIMTGVWIDAAFLPDQRILAVGGLWSADGQQRLQVLRTPHQVDHLDVSDDRFVLANLFGVVVVHGHDGHRLGRRRFPLAPHREGPQRLSHIHFDPTGERLVATFQKGTLRVLDAHSERLETAWERDLGSSLSAPRFFAEGRRLAVGDWGRAHPYSHEGRHFPRCTMRSSRRGHGRGL